MPAKTNTKANQDWDAPENEAQNNFVSWSEIGDYVLGTLIGVREVESTLPDKKGEKQKIYDMKVRKCEYHTLDEKKRVNPDSTVIEEGEIVSVGGRKTIDSRMARVKLGQIVGLKFTDELPAKTKGYNPTKLIKVFTPKTPSGDYEMDEKWLEENKDSLDAFPSEEK